MDDHEQRARFLMDQERYPEALAELQQAETARPDSPFVHGLRARCLMKLNRLQQANEAAQRCIEVAPDFDYGHYVMADVLAEQLRFKEARESARTAVRLDPEDSSNHGQLARMECELGNWRESLAAADAGLQLDAGDDFCRHWRAHALRKLGRKEEADREVEFMMSEDPEDPFNHDAKGWFLLEEGRHEQARTDFLEALRLMPGLESARIGFANALKSRHFVFSRLLRLLIWLARFRTWAIYAGAIAVFLSLRVADKWLTQHPEQYVWVTVAKFVVWTVVVLLVVGQPLFDLVLRFDPEGRRVLTETQRKASFWCGLAFLWALVIMGLWAWKGGRMMPSYALCALMLSSPINHVFEASCGWVRVRMKWITIFAALLIPLAWFMPIAVIVFTVKTKIFLPWLIKGVFFVPLISILISAFSDNILEHLEKRRPDAA